MSLDEIYKQIDAEGFSARTLDAIDNFSNEIINGRTNFSRYTLEEHSGVCKAGAPLIGATVIAGYARASLETGADAATGQGNRPSNWEIDEAQEKAIEQWAKAARIIAYHSDTALCELPAIG